ncbi:virulence protein RhuM/Fic/DOC family protein [Patescibacteria group bacterium]|nr:virulence protein RhuM/Fic/DOC family protein [Patescibacteria group bacterium]MBU3999749.1 virulence protein RhuM/Fic/DOC family protein [Patescibacteria group bacterium]MBU4056818.1 virulence protein RhuM/Fic/DOC family protein [Patescibacteria group bacterium]MBU4368535.1 virulence protein RhuM/Fic/DOC family protein [Patescibacteria group bacterium]
MNKNNLQKGGIVIYKISKNEVELRVRFKNESVWLRQNEIALLFDKERSVITKHIKKIFADKEVDSKSNVQKMHIPNSDKPVEFYSLDVILAVGYRVNSSRAIHFRNWATKILKQYLIKGYAINKKRLLEAQNKFHELQEAVLFLQKQSKKELLSGQEAEILNLLADYSKTLSLLEQYDKGQLADKKEQKTELILDYKACVNIIAEIKKELMIKKEASSLFGNEAGRGFEGIIKNLYQTFGGKELYKTIEEKAAHLLYFTIKDHYFTDGNKRIASFLFVYFLDKADYLFKKSGERKINDNALTALALFIAESDPKEKEIMIKIVKNLLAE